MPLGTISGAGWIARPEAGVTCANRGSGNDSDPFDKLCRKSETLVRKSKPPPGPAKERQDKDGAPPVRGTSGADSSSKIKRRRWAAEVETTAEDIKFLEKFQGAPGLGFLAGAPEADQFYFRFLFA
jgi:hypothetical protein